MDAADSFGFRAAVQERDDEIATLEARLAEAEKLLRRWLNYTPSTYWYHCGRDPNHTPERTKRFCMCDNCKATSAFLGKEHDRE